MQKLAIAAVAVVLAFLGGLWLISRPSPEDFAQCSASTAGGDIGGPLELVGSTGQTVTDKEIFTEPSLVYFGYTFCPDVCPLDVSRNVEAIDVLTERGLNATPVFITIDPARDTVDVMADYASNLHEKMIALTGSEAQIDAASKAYKTYFKRHLDQGEDYLVDHSTFTYLVLPEHGFVEFFRRDVTPDAMADRVACFIQNS